MHHLEVIEEAVKELTIKYEWVPVLAPDGKPYSYPGDHKRLRQVSSKPVVYRWVASQQGRTPNL